MKVYNARFAKKHNIIVITYEGEDGNTHVLNITPENVLENHLSRPTQDAADTPHVCGWCKGNQELIWACPVCNVG